jgi:hypothetical protein
MGRGVRKVGFWHGPAAMVEIGFLDAILGLNKRIFICGWLLCGPFLDFPHSFVVALGSAIGIVVLRHGCGGAASRKVEYGWEGLYSGLDNGDRCDNKKRARRRGISSRLSNCLYHRVAEAGTKNKNVGGVKEELGAGASPKVLTINGASERLFVPVETISAPKW